VAVALAALALAAPAAAQEITRYSVANGCWALKAPNGRFVAKSGDGYRASAATMAGAERFRMRATTLGRYLLYGRAGDFLAAGSGGLPIVTPANRVESAARASDNADWRLEPAAGGTFTLVLQSDGRPLSLSGDAVVMGGQPARFALVQGDSCAQFPEVEVNAVGTPAGGATPFGEVRGFIDAHMHMMAFEFLGGRAHCGRPWHPYGVEHALVDCPDHYPNGAGAVLENVLFGNPARTHDPIGWPTFKDWPHHQSLTHEQSYYKWLERAWMGGLRVFVNLFVDNVVLCQVYPLKQNSCDEMDSVRLQARRIRELQDYIDAQSGGPGRGWFRIVTDPFEARRVINDGKLAVVLGIEVSRLFNCRVFNDRPTCDKAQIDRQLDEVHELGVRDMELVNKFDNALGGVAGDSGTTGVVVNTANFIETGRFWQLEHCDGHNHVHDREQPTIPGVERDALLGNGLQAFLPPGATPVYGAPPHCNLRGLSDLGEHLVRRMIDKRMIIDPDHLSVLARKQLLSVVEAEGYPGVVSSHSWSTPDAWPRIYKLGGFIAPYAGSAESFVRAWRETKPHADPRFHYGIGYGADMNGFGAQGGPRNGPNPVQYPFKSFDGGVTLERQRSGQRVFDVNTDGVAHYGLYPDWVEDLRRIAGDGIVEDMARGSEAYLQMWERAVGVPAPSCRASSARLTRGGLGRLRIGDGPDALLRRAGQPRIRADRRWTWCATGGGEVTAALTPDGRVALAATTARGHRALGAGTGAKARRLRTRGKRRGFRTVAAAKPRTLVIRRGARRPLRVRRLANGLFVKSAGRGKRFVYGIRGNRVRFVAVAARSASPSPKALRAYLRVAGLR
jgi:microsomal dipeptidase-like Zn-dependent dipeptidase